MKIMTKLRAAGVALLALATVAASSTGAVAKGPPYKIFLSMSYIGNDWQAESANMLKAMAASPALRDKVDLHIQVAGASPQKQIQQINAMVQSGADAIIMYASSETQLNAAVKNACARGVIVYTYDSPITEPCAYQLTVDQRDWGKTTAEWLAKTMNYKGNVVMVTGVPGTSVATQRQQEAEKVFAKYPDLKVIAKVNGMWTPAVIRSVVSQVLATSSWDNIGGMWMDTGCYTVGSMQEEAGIPDDKKRPCAGEAENGARLQLLPASTKVDGANGTYRPMGYPGISVASPTFEGGLALKRAVEILEGKKDMPHMTIIPLPVVSSDNVKLCLEGSWKEMKETGCNVFQPAIISNPGWASSIFSPDTPEIGLAAALTGEPEQP